MNQSFCLGIYEPELEFSHIKLIFFFLTFVFVLSSFVKMSLYGVIKRNLLFISWHFGILYVAYKITVSRPHLKTLSTVIYNT